MEVTTPPPADPKLQPREVGADNSAVDRRSPLFIAEHSERYGRQQLIRDYETQYNCRLVVLRAALFPDSVTYLEELLFDADPAEDLHMLLDSPGGDGETAVRLARSAQARCRKFTVIVPDQAKSAATILAMGAHEVLMGPTSDLGPVDPQFVVGGAGLFAARDIVAAVDTAQDAVTKSPESYPIHAALLSNVDALLVQAARTAIERTPDLVKAALMCNPDRTDGEAEAILAKAEQPLIQNPREHAAVVGAHEAREFGLPVRSLDPLSDQWQRVWRLYAKYFILSGAAYEGRFASRILSGSR